MGAAVAAEVALEAAAVVAVAAAAAAASWAGLAIAEATRWAARPTKATPAALRSMRTAGEGAFASDIVAGGACGGCFGGAGQQVTG